MCECTSMNGDLLDALNKSCFTTSLSIEKSYINGILWENNNYVVKIQTNIPTFFYLIKQRRIHTLNKSVIVYYQLIFNFPYQHISIRNADLGPLLITLRTARSVDDKSPHEKYNKTRKNYDRFYLFEPTEADNDTG